MRKNFLAVIVTLLWLSGCVSGPITRHVEEILYDQGKLQKYSYYDESYGEKTDSSAFTEAIDIIKQADPTALPELDAIVGDSKRQRSMRAYTGIIKNNTKYELSVPSQNSLGTLIIPPKGWIEYTVWEPRARFSPYLNGEPYRCFDIKPKPKAYDFMCKKYDFMAVIDAAEKPEYYKKYKKRVRKKKSA